MQGSMNDSTLCFPLADNFLQGPMLVYDKLLEYTGCPVSYTPAACHPPAWALARSRQQEENQECSHLWPPCMSIHARMNRQCCLTVEEPWSQEAASGFHGVAPEE